MQAAAGGRTALWPSRPDRRSASAAGRILRRWCLDLDEPLAGVFASGGDYLVKYSMMPSTWRSTMACLPALD